MSPLFICGLVQTLITLTLGVKKLTNSSICHCAFLPRSIKGEDVRLCQRTQSLLNVIFTKLCLFIKTALNTMNFETKIQQIGYYKHNTAFKTTPVDLR